MRSVSGLPGGRIACEQEGLLLCYQRENLVGLRLECIGAARGWPATPERRLIAMVPQPQRVPQLRGNHMARDVGARERIPSITPDPNQDLLAGLEDRGERDEVPVRHGDEDLSPHKPGHDLLALVHFW
jgi:hypothetical protein